MHVRLAGHDPQRRPRFNPDDIQALRPYSDIALDPDHVLKAEDALGERFGDALSTFGRLHDEQRRLFLVRTVIVPVLFSGLGRASNEQREEREEHELR